jgi:hypothetical protein
MNLIELKEILSTNQNKLVSFSFPDSTVPEHYHLTEVGKETRSFIDCGGTKRKTEKCVLQLWVANDTDHRISSDKFLKIINLANDLFEHDTPEVYVEYEMETVSQYPILNFKIDEEKISIYLGKTHTACLAPEKCGVSCCKPQELVTLK